MLELGGLAVEADASSEDVLTRLHIDRARGLIAAVGTDAENVYIVLTARVLRPDLYIVGRAETEDAERKLLKAGANRVVSPYRIGARELAQTALRPAVVDFFELATRAGNLELAIEQVTIDDGSALAGSTIIEANVRQRFGVIVVGIQRRQGQMEFNPPGDAVMHSRRPARRAGPRGRPARTRTGGAGGPGDRPSAPPDEDGIDMAARILDGNGHGRGHSGRNSSRGPRRSPHAPARRPALGVILAGNDPGSEIYVRNKLKAAAETGIRAELIRIAADAHVDDVLGGRRAAQRPRRHRRHPRAVAAAGRAWAPTPRRACSTPSTPRRTSTGSRPSTSGCSCRTGAGLVACTPAGVMELLDRSGIVPQGMRAVVIGRSDIVGKPMALLLLHRHATVTICHSRTRDLPAVAREADILVAAIGRPAFVTPEFVKPGAVVIDVGINAVTDEALVRSWFPPDSPRLAAFAKRGTLTVGDVHPAVAEVAGALTPVPGGVGPLTIAMLLGNTVRAAEARLAR